MIYTKEQKRDIAEQLRHWGSYEGKCKLINKYVCGVLGVEGRDALNMLADLIEPEPERTCRVVTDKNTVSQTQEVHTKYCSECSYVFGREQHRPLLPGLDEEFVLHAVQIPDYCPNCGAKVTEVGQ